MIQEKKATTTKHQLWAEITVRISLLSSDCISWHLIVHVSVTMTQETLHSFQDKNSRQERLVLFPEGGGGYLRIHACIWLKTITPLEGQVIKKKIKTDLSAEKDVEKHCSVECKEDWGYCTKRWADGHLRTMKKKKRLIHRKSEAWTARGTVMWMPLRLGKSSVWRCSQRL